MDPSLIAMMRLREGCLNLRMLFPLRPVHGNNMSPLYNGIPGESLDVALGAFSTIHMTWHECPIISWLTNSHCR